MTIKQWQDVPGLIKSEDNKSMILTGTSTGTLASMVMGFGKRGLLTGFSLNLVSMTVIVSTGNASVKLVIVPFGNPEAVIGSTVYYESGARTVLNVSGNPFIPLSDGDVVKMVYDRALIANDVFFQGSFNYYLFD